MIACTVELFGVARLVAKTREVSLDLERDATFAHVFAALAGRIPTLIGKVIVADGMRLADGYACSRNGLEFVRDPVAPVNGGDVIAILAADAGG